MASQEQEENYREPLGLYAKDEILPIFSTEINAEINDKFAKVKLTHTYFNPYDDYLDTSFKFPKGLYQVFDGLEAEVDGKKLKGLVGLKKNVAMKFVSELSKGSTVIKTEEEKPPSAKTKRGLLITKIGNIPPKKEIKITFSFIQNLDISLNKKLKFVLPLVLTPKYVPLESTINLLKDYIYNGPTIKNIAELNSRLKEGKIKYSWPEDNRNRLTMMGKFDHVREIERHTAERYEPHKDEIQDELKRYRQMEQFTVKAPSKQKA